MRQHIWLTWGDICASHEATYVPHMRQHMWLTWGDICATHEATYVLHIRQHMYHTWGNIFRLSATHEATYNFLFRKLSFSIGNEQIFSILASTVPKHIVSVSIHNEIIYDIGANYSQKQCDYVMGNDRIPIIAHRIQNPFRRTREHFYYEWAKRTKFLLAVIYGSPCRH